MTSDELQRLTDEMWAGWAKLMGALYKLQVELKKMEP